MKHLAARGALIDRHVPGGAQLFHRIFTRLNCNGRPPQFVVEFHPYADLTHTIRLRQEIAYVRLSDILRDADLQVFESAAAILLSRMYRRKTPREYLNAYREFTYSRQTRARLTTLRRTRSRKTPRTTSRKNLRSFAALREIKYRIFRKRIA